MVWQAHLLRLSDDDGPVAAVISLGAAVVGRTRLDTRAIWHELVELLVPIASKAQLVVSVVDASGTQLCETVLPWEQLAQPSRRALWPLVSHRGETDAAVTGELAMQIAQKGGVQRPLEYICYSARVVVRHGERANTIESVLESRATFPRVV